MNRRWDLPSLDVFPGDRDEKKPNFMIYFGFSAFVATLDLGGTITQAQAIERNDDFVSSKIIIFSLRKSAPAAG